MYFLEKYKRLRRRSELPKTQIDTTSLQETDGSFSPLSSPPVDSSEFNANQNVESTTMKPSKQTKRSISNSYAVPNASNSQSGKPKSDEDSGGQLFFW